MGRGGRACWPLRQIPAPAGPSPRPFSAQAWKHAGDVLAKHKGDKPYIAELYGYAFAAAKADVWHTWDNTSLIYPGFAPMGASGGGGAWLQHAQGHMWQLPPAARPCAVRGSALGVTARPRLPLAWLLRRRAPYHSLRRGLHTRERRQLNLEIQQARVSGGADNAPEQQLALAWTDALVVQPPGRSGRRGPAARKAGFTHPRAPFKHPAPLPPPAMLTSTGPAATIGTCRHPTRTPACSRRRPSPRSSRNT